MTTEQPEMFRPLRGRPRVRSTWLVNLQTTAEKHMASKKRMIMHAEKHWLATKNSCLITSSHGQFFCRLVVSPSEFQNFPNIETFQNTRRNWVMFSWRKRDLYNYPRDLKWCTLKFSNFTRTFAINLLSLGINSTTKKPFLSLYFLFPKKGKK